ncbi:hypothetical protein CU633_19610 [Bacillus sp. V3-13]|uniref:amidase domain-containing protein n=1 Tax=Bacillus sp. V3-13 TaxID=2053728 RepID=UPI000C771859|nr:amidase domain-containing protein [Bacillus sp. V3-13]PLR75726.1 hypothetical protein CU633_19610 [Bacillus sp. V3-13]
MREQLQTLLGRRVNQYISQTRSDKDLCEKIEIKKDCLSKRSAEIVKAAAKGKITEKQEEDDHTILLYEVHFQFLIRQKGMLYMEEEIEKREAGFYKGVLIEDKEISLYAHENRAKVLPGNPVREMHRTMNDFHYDRLKAVQYAERWWNDYNPSFKKFEVDCTNYISQCLHAGGAPMRGYPNRSNGWWMRNNNWSYSWAVANSLRWYLPASKTGLRGKEVESADKLLLGDVICYDFQGDGRFDHNTIVTGKDAFGMPLVNAHTHNSRMRYWAYEDSTAYTPNIKYKFITIVDDQ